MGGGTTADEGDERDLETGLDSPIRRPNPYFDPQLPQSPKSPKSPLAILNSSKSLLVSNSNQALVASNSGKALLISNSGKSLSRSNLGKRFEKKKYVRQVTGRFNDTELHLVAQQGDLAAVKQILDDIDAQMVGTLSGADFDAEVAEMRSAIVNEANELGETALFTAAEKGHLDVVCELLPYSTNEGIRLKNLAGFDPLHIAANQGHEAIVQVLLEHDLGLSKTIGQSKATPLISAATRGHLGVVKVLLEKDSSLLETSRSNGKNALHLAARQGHIEIVKELIARDPQLVRRTDKKGQTALHMAVKGVSVEVVKLLVSADSTIVMLPDRFGNFPLHIATRKKRAEILNELLRLPETNVNALTREQKTAIDIAEGLPFSVEISEIKDILGRCGCVRANELNQVRDELRKTVTQIRKDVSVQLEQARMTDMNVQGIAKLLQKFHRAGITNTTNSVTVVASLFATVTFTAVFTVPGGDNNDGMGVVASGTSFRLFFFFNALALFTSLAVVLVQITIVRGEIKMERRVVEVINKLMWLASVFTSVAFISAAFIVLGRHNMWAAILCTVIGGFTLTGVLIMMTYFVLKSKRLRKMNKKKKMMRPPSDSESDEETNQIYAI